MDQVDFSRGQNTFFRGSTVVKFHITILKLRPLAPAADARECDAQRYHVLLYRCIHTRGWSCLFLAFLR